MLTSNTSQAPQTGEGRWLFPLASMLIVALVIWVYLPGLHGGFLFDDDANILENPKVLMEQLGWRELQWALWSSDSGLFQRPVSMLSFALNHLWTGLDPYWFKATNLAIHLLSGMGLFFLTSVLLRCSGRYPAQTRNLINWVALAVSAAWLMHPFNLTPVLYVVQRMTGLSALFSIWAMVLYANGRYNQMQGGRGTLQIIFSVLLLVPLSVLSKENGMLVFPMLFLFDWIIAGFQVRTVAQKVFLYLFYGLTIAVPLLILVAVFSIYPDYITSLYVGRDFDLYQRILTEARVLFFYANMIVLPDITRMGLFHDDFVVSVGMFSPWTTWISFFGVSLIGVVAILLRKAYPFVAFGVLFFLAGHFMESTFLPLELVHEHRNYLPSYGLMLAIFVPLLSSLFRSEDSMRSLRIFLSLAIIAVLAASTAVRAKTWSNNVDLALNSVHHHPQSSRSNIDAGGIYFKLSIKDPKHSDEHFDQAREYFRAAVRAGSMSVAEFSLLMIDDRQGRPVNRELLLGLAKKLSSPPLHVSTVSAMLLLGKCQLEGTCHFPVGAIDLLYSSLLTNPQLSPAQRTQLLTLLVQRAADAGDLDEAAMAAAAAVESTPHRPQVRLNYAAILIARGELGKAQTQIQAAQLYDHDQFYQHRIETQQASLRAAHAPGTGDTLPQDLRKDP